MNKAANQEKTVPVKKHWLESRAALCTTSFVIFFICGLFSVGGQAYWKDEIWTRTQFLQAAFLRALVAFVVFQFFYWPLFNKFVKAKSPNE